MSKLGAMPRSLFWRMVALLLVALTIAVLAMVLLFRQDRAGLIARNFSEAKIAQIEALRNALNKMAAEDRSGRPFMGLQMVGREYGALLVPVDRRPEIGQMPRGPALQPLVDKLQEQLGRDTEVRLGMRMDQPVVWIRLNVGPEGNTRGVWAGFPIRNVDSGEVPTRLWITLGAVLLLLLAGTYWFARRLAKPLAELADAVDKVAEGKRPDPLPVDGPEEISRVARNVNRMAANLEQLERDRSTMLAGISHDIRTPLTRLRLASEISVNDAQSRDEMAADIDEIDRIVTQFLDFARGTPKEAPAQADLQIVLGAIAHKAASRNLPVTWQPGPEALVVNAYPAAFERMLMNLIENAHRYGKPPVELAVRRDGAMVDIDVLDAGDGVSAGDVERLKQPFVRGDHARGGTMGAGLGLAIVERLAKWHGGSFDLLPRSGGGTVARVRLPLASSV
ncbi:ATP-binding protein [Casimicrobium huifangae]|jgi:two-component system osmolarity sensor histidine kinase EnvZ|uniref:ATP-binding protein n=1 Tax=Casimicrobium huifangae TaxID=2591109 RepID=UPI00378377C7